ncbi:hypothetical protein [Bradyrhizobium sp. 164]|uniref:hypothetical protein n=1 Tax=Bradyrhizobium sp. 164 TaxID=2782637 RepID=UPI001FF9B19E|nr:hypothetical protein [Bradyrhizobium sp. 164]MCK1647206.1 hypothetical protein [Bradyrhizobium sp. 154]
MLAPEAMRRRCRRRVVRAKALLTAEAALQCLLRSTPSRPSLPSPRFVTIAIRPLSRARVLFYTTNPNFGKYEYFAERVLTAEGAEVVSCFARRVMADGCAVTSFCFEGWCS